MAIKNMEETKVIATMSDDMFLISKKKFKTTTKLLKIKRKVATEYKENRVVCS